MDETLLLIQQAQQGDQEAIERLVKENSGLIWAVVKKFLNRGYDADDLYQIGSIGLLKCIKKFDTSYNVKFSTYAVPMIMGEIKRFLRDDGLIKVSRNLKELAVKARYTSDALSKKLGKTPNIYELAEEMNVSAEDLVLALEANLEVESLYSTVNKTDSNPMYLIDRLAEKDNEAKMIDFIALKEIIQNLKPKEREIIMLRYFDDKTQTETAKEIGVSQVQISRIEKKVLQAIRSQF